MKQHLVELERIHFTRAFPWVNLFRAFRLALDVRKMLLGAMALLVLGGGLYALSYLPLNLTEAETEPHRQPPWAITPNPLPQSPSDFLRAGYWNGLGLHLSRPVLSLLEPAVVLVNEPLVWTEAAWRWTEILWALCVWSLFGTMISRMSAVQFAVDQRVSLKEGLKFAGSKWLWVISAPLMPLAGLVGLWFLCVVGGWIGRIPGAGPIILGVLWFIPLLLVLGMVLLFIGLGFGWPLMIATISTQGSDAFDGFSRSFDYVYSRFWHLIWFVIVAAVHGLLMLALVSGVAHVVILLASTFVSMSLGEALADSPAFLAGAVEVWIAAVALLVAGYAVSYFWSASTIIYFLLRQSEDANHLSEVYLPKPSTSEDLVQLAGVAASDQPVIERPAKHQPESRQQPVSETEPSE